MNPIERERQAERRSARRAGDRDRPGRRITKRDSRYQKPASAGRASRSAARRQPLRREGVDPRPEHGEQRRQHDERERRPRSARRSCPRSPSSTGSAAGTQQRGDCRGDRERAVEDRPARGLQRATQRRRRRTRIPRPPRGAGDDEQAVVDRQAEPEAGDEVEREDGEVGELATIRSAKNVPTIASPPSSGGSSAATRQRKNSSESKKMNGNASSSARARSWPTCALT